MSRGAIVSNDLWNNEKHLKCYSILHSQPMEASDNVGNGMSVIVILSYILILQHYFAQIAILSADGNVLQDTEHYSSQV